ncbi:hypothetical protein ACFQY4_16545 [Catellatospora bangladeshensis]|uniref:Uncharacterized protein n=1 Tax=Catellatospora bangladeshensis TaxID=310355 RepID=A0A8J3JV40_9ACTN|nr:hypothetical protein [Catellatospora bangladeshensis]GIF84274.1 hypothetical protein Cba03nite_56230 [Catellatospora bangladeshensis]
MRTIKSVARIAAVSGLMAASFVAATAAPAAAAGCNSGNTSYSTFRAGGCSGYPSNWKVQARTSCLGGSTAYGSWVSVGGYSYATCAGGRQAFGGSYSVSP